MRWGLPTTVLLLTANLAACHALDRSHYHQLLEGGSCVANTDGGTVGDGCALFHEPARSPDASDLSPDSGAHVFAMRTTTFGFNDTTARATTGIDRDQLCTRAALGSPQGCNPIGNTATNPIPPVEDGLGGRDNALATTLGAYFSTANWNEAQLNLSMEHGTRSLGVRISSYGGPDDAQVSVEWFPIINGHAAGTTADAPRWDGTDVWAIDSRLAYDPVQPTRILIRSTVGYTACGTLVARLPSRMPLRFSSTARTIRLTISNALMVGPIDPSGHHFGPIDFSGAWIVNDALSDIATLNLCPATTGPQAVLWGTAIAVLNASADVLSTGENSPGTDCDAISAAFNASFVEIALGPDMPSSDTESSCP